MVTKTSVYHWSMSGDSGPVKIFDRHASLNGENCKIVSYRANADCKWLVLIGYEVISGRVKGSMQLYNTDKLVSQPIEGHAAEFSSVKIGNNSSPSNLICFASKTEANGKLHIIEVGGSLPGNSPFPKKSIDVPYSQDGVPDFPVTMQVPFLNF